MRFLVGVVTLLLPALPVFVVICLVTGIPAAVAIWLSEGFEIRSVLFFVGVGGAIGGTTPALLLRAMTPRPMPDAASLLFATLPFVLAGLAAGFVYWRVAGKHAGEKRSDDRS
jgi:hypothetical protein